MKKILLTVAAACIGTAMFAQQTDAFLASWTSAKQNTVKNTKTKEVAVCKNMVIDFSNPLVKELFVPVVDAATGKTDGKGWYWAGQNGTDKPFKVSYNDDEKAIQVDVDLSAKVDGTGTATDNNWDGFNFTWATQKDNAGTGVTAGVDAGFNPFAVDKAVWGKDSLYAEFVDVTPKLSRAAVVTYKIKDAPAANLRMDLTDANGRTSNRRTPHHPIVQDGTNWKTVPFSWGSVWNSANDSKDYDADMLQDGWVGAWLNVENGRNLKAPAVPLGGLPEIKTTDDNDNAVPLDPTAICKFDFSINDAKKFAESTTKPVLTVYIKSVQIGEGTEEAYDLVKARKDPSYVWPTRVDPCVADANSKDCLCKVPTSHACLCMVPTSKTCLCEVPTAQACLCFNPTSTECLCQAGKEATKECKCIDPSSEGCVCFADATAKVCVCTKDPNAAVCSISTSLISEYSIYPSIGRVFNFEGKGEMKNVGGFVVKTGVNKIDANDLPEGTYFITVDGVTTATVTVK